MNSIDNDSLSGAHNIPIYSKPENEQKEKWQTDNRDAEQADKQEQIGTRGSLLPTEDHLGTCMRESHARQLMEKAEQEAADKGGQVHSVASSSHKVADDNTPLGQVKAALQCHFSSNITGCNLVIMREGSHCRLSAGAILPNAAQHWGSVSKQFTAACIAKLVKDGLLRWDDDISKLCRDLPKFKLDGVVQRVTVDDLLHMRSGLPEFFSLALVSGQDPERLDNTEILALLNTHPALIYTPGSQEMYCNTNYSILAKIVEEVAKRNQLLKEGQTFVDFVREQIFVPLGMTARCAIDTVDKVTTIRGFNDKGKDCTTQSPSYGAGGVIGAPTDMIAWNTALSNKEWDALTESPNCVKVIPNEPLYCRGLIVTAVSDYRRIHHGGEISGFVTIFRRYVHNSDPEKTFAYFLATNLENVKKAEDAADEVANALAGTKIEGANSQGTGN